ncbi:MAG: Lipid 3-O-deacylase-related protein [Candidatus Angelobacter sp.]|nr:Lipid 3-O-deacylase-related protein [Candidatus Angelobacter sp.]
MRRIFAAVLLLSLSAFAQTAKPATVETSTLPLHKGALEFDAFTGGGTGFGKRSSTQFFYVGGRFGKVLTRDVGRGWIHGNLEYVFEALPFIAILQPPNATYGGGFSPMDLKWNFTRGKRMIPFAELGGGAMWTGQDVPFGTNNFNFTPQGGFGVHFLVKPKQAVTFTGKYMHVSNAGIADANSGINASIQLVLGYTWFK